MKKIIVALENNEFTINGIVDIAERTDVHTLTLAYAPREKPNVADFLGTNSSLSSYRPEPELHYIYRFCRFMVDVPAEFQHIIPVYVPTGVYDRVVGGYLVLVGSVIK